MGQSEVWLGRKYFVLLHFLTQFLMKEIFIFIKPNLLVGKRSNSFESTSIELKK